MNWQGYKFLFLSTALFSLLTAGAILSPAYSQLAISSLPVKNQLGQVSGTTSQSASNKACLLSYLTNLPNQPATGGRSISGQTTGWPWRDNFWQIEETQRITGQWVGILHLDLTSSVGGYNWTAALNKAIDYANQGGVISTAVHWINPHPNGGNTVRSTTDTIPNLTNVITPGTAEYTKFKKEVDEVAGRLAVFKNAGIPVLFVPFNEIDIGTNTKWYAGRGDDVQGIKNLQIWLHNYLTNTKGLDNLIWAYNATRPDGNVLRFYPGNAYYDMATLNWGNKGYCDPGNVGYYSAAYQQMLSTGKPFSFAEGFNFASCTNPMWDWSKAAAGLKNFYPKTSYWVTYDTFNDGTQDLDFSLHHAERNPGGIMNDPWTINRGEINWQQTCGGTTGGSTTTTPPPTTATSCNSYGNTSTPPAAFGASYNLFSSTKELLVSASCDTNSATFTVGNGQTTTYIWNQAYYTKNGQTWTPITLTGPNTAGNGQWIIGSANSTQPLTSTELSTQNYLAAYVCTYQNNAWKCGCSDTTCAIPKWNLQGFRK